MMGIYSIDLHLETRLLTHFVDPFSLDLVKRYREFQNVLDLESTYLLHLGMDVQM